jgi:putative transposase
MSAWPSQSATYGRWRYLYRAISRSGALADVMLREKAGHGSREMVLLFSQVVTGVTPSRVTTNGHDSNPRAISEQLGETVRYRTSGYLNNRMSNRIIAGSKAAMVR